MGLKKAISKTYQRFSKWTFEPQPLPDKALIIGAYHTSNWDGWLMLMAMWDQGLNFKFLVKNSLTKGIVGPIIRAIGGIGVDRSKPNALVQDVISRLEKEDNFYLILTPEGTRSKREYWKSGFYHIAQGANLPVVLGFIDSKRRTYGWAHAIELTGDVSADMDKIRQFYATTAGFHPELATFPRLRSEDKTQ